MDTQDEKLNYTINHSVFNIANTVVDFATQPNANYTANISSKENDAILLSESYFMIQYETTGANRSCLIPNWFLSMINSFNLSINSFSINYNTINAGRSLPMLAQCLRYLRYENEDFNKYSSMQREIFQKRYLTAGADAANSPVYNNGIEYYPIETINGGTNINHCIVNLKDIFPSASTFNQVNGLLSMSLVLSYDKAIQSLSNSAFTNFKINFINFHYPVKTYDFTNNIDIDLNYISTYGILQGTIPQLYANPSIFTFPTLIEAGFNTRSESVTMSNIQLSVNKIYKLLIFPIFKNTSTTACTYVLPIKNNAITCTTKANNEILVTDDVLRTNVGLGTLPGGIGSHLWGVRNIKVVVNGSRVLPTNVVQPYSSPYFSQWYNYDFSFNSTPLNSLSKPNLFFDSDMYNNFSPIIVDLSNATSNNSFNSLSFSFDVFNRFARSAVNAGEMKFELSVNYAILNEIVLNES